MEVKPEIVTWRFGRMEIASPEGWLFDTLSRHGMGGTPDPKQPDDLQIDLRRYASPPWPKDWMGRACYPLPHGTIAVLRKARNGRRAWEVHKLNRRITQDELSVMWDALASELGDTLIAVYQLDVLPFRRVGV